MADSNAYHRAQPERLMRILIVSLFFLWGIANSLNDVLLGQFKKAFDLTDFQSSLVQQAFYLGYFLLAMPAATLIRRRGYKSGVVLGLFLYGCGALLFFPAAEARTYALFLGALFVIASGLAFLETSANPLMTVLGSPDTAARRLNFAQAFNPLGTLTGVLIGRNFILAPSTAAANTPAIPSAAQLDASRAAAAHAVQLPYLVLGALVLAWAIVNACTRYAGAAGRPPTDSDTRIHFAPLLKRRRYLFGVWAQFCYVGAQVGVWSYTIRYAQHALPGIADQAAADYLFASLFGFMLGRFAGTALMGRYPPARLMLVFAVVNVALTMTAVMSGGSTGLLALVATGFFMSIMFPTIFAIALEGLGPLTQAGSSLLVMAIIGGAVFTGIMGRISDLSSIQQAMWVPAVCFAMVGAYARYATQVRA
jgi:FHS family L-fucose permease-like MFS transporter